jgi:hypothetical protein
MGQDVNSDRLKGPRTQDRKAINQSGKKRKAENKCRLQQRIRDKISKKTRKLDEEEQIKARQRSRDRLRIKDCHASLL